MSWKAIFPGLYAIFVTTRGLKVKVVLEVPAASATPVRPGPGHRQSENGGGPVLDQQVPTRDVTANATHGSSQAGLLPASLDQAQAGVQPVIDERWWGPVRIATFEC